MPDNLHEAMALSDEVNATENDLATFEAYRLRMAEKFRKGSAAGAGMPQSSNDPGQEGVGQAKLDQFMKAVQDGFDLRCAIGQKFNRWLAAKPDKQQEYKQCTSRQAKADFRNKYASDRYQEHMQGKRQTKKLTQADQVKGSWHTFGGLVIKYGGWSWQPAICGAKNTALKCSLLGGRWLKVDMV